MCVSLCVDLCGVLGTDWKSERYIVTSRSPDGLTGCVEAIGSVAEDREVTWKSDTGVQAGGARPRVLVQGYH